MDTIKIKDSTFLPYSKSASLRGENAHVHPTHFQWEYSEDDYVIATDGNIRGMKEGSIAWLIEPRCLHPENYELPELETCRMIFTHDEQILNKFPDRARFVPLGGLSIAKYKLGRHPKRKKVCMFVSEKNTTEGHRMRHMIVDAFKDQIDFYGAGVGNPVPHKYNVLAKYEFCVVVESCQYDYYFTEKLIDPISVGTIPIYWGCPSIGKFFPYPWGIHIFQTYDGLQDILNEINNNPSFYDAHVGLSSLMETAYRYRITEGNIDLEWLKC